MCETYPSTLYLTHTQGILPSRNLSEGNLQKPGISATLGAMSSISLKRQPQEEQEVAQGTVWPEQKDLKVEAWVPAGPKLEIWSPH